jgi:UDP-3-O-[3-hydroxymyristoyl] N-acetylglucosamine deacetylase
VQPGPEASGCVVLRGRGLHSGAPAEVRLTRIEGPVVFRTQGGDAPRAALSVVRADHGVRVRCDAIGLDVDGVEHLLAALGGLSMHSGIALEVTGGEVPLLDGAAAAFAEALRGLAPASGAPVLTVVRSDVVRIGDSSYSFAPADATELDVAIRFQAPRIGEQRAAWDGRTATFLADVAWARTFGFRHDREALHAGGRARGVDPLAVMVLDADGAVEPPGAPARPGEFARHKLLDLVGDLFLFGGPPVGRIHATRPGHGATHRAVLEAIERGILARGN